MKTNTQGEKSKGSVDWMRGVEPIDTGLDGIDEITGGLGPVQFGILGSRDPISKFDLALNIALNVAVDGTAVIMYLHGHRKADVRLRILSIFTGIPTDSIDVDSKRVKAECEKVFLLPIFIYEHPGIDVSLMTDIARRHVNGYKKSMIIIDDFESITPDVDCDSRYESLFDIAHELIRMSRKLNTFVFALCGANRKTDGEWKLNELPFYADDAAVAMLLDKTSLCLNEIRLARLYIPKDRSGRTGCVDLAYKQANGRFFS